MNVKRIITIMMFMATSIVLVGCGSTPSENDIKNDLSTYVDMELFDISDVIIDKELIDGKKDVIDCTVKTSNEYADMIYYLTVDYTNYDTGGWQIDDVQKIKETDFTILSTPTDEELTSKCQEYLDGFDNIVESQIDTPVLDTLTGTGTISAKAILKETDYVIYYRKYNCSIAFEDGYWYTYGDNALSDTLYSCLNTENLVGNSFYGDYSSYNILLNIENISQASDSYELDYSYAYKNRYSDNNSVIGNNKVHLAFSYNDSSDIASYSGNLLVDGEFDDSNAVLSISNAVVQLRGAVDGWITGGILKPVNKNDYSSMYDNLDAEAPTESIGYGYTELYGFYRLELNNAAGGWCDLTIQPSSGDNSDWIYISGYENGDRETAYFCSEVKKQEGYYSAYNDATNCNITITPFDGGVKIQVLNSDTMNYDYILEGEYNFIQELDFDQVS